MTRLDGLLQTIAKGLGKDEKDENPLVGLLGLSTNSQGIPLQNANFEGNGLYEEGVDRALASRNSIDFGTALPFQGVPDANFGSNVVTMTHPSGVTVRAYSPEEVAMYKKNGYVAPNTTMNDPITGSAAWDSNDGITVEGIASGTTNFDDYWNEYDARPDMPYTSFFERNSDTDAMGNPIQDQSWDGRNINTAADRYANKLNNLDGMGPSDDYYEGPIPGNDSLAGNYYGDEVSGNADNSFFDDVGWGGRDTTPYTMYHPSGFTRTVAGDEEANLFKKQGYFSTAEEAQDAAAAEEAFNKADASQSAFENQWDAEQYNLNNTPDWFGQGKGPMTDAVRDSINPFGGSDTTKPTTPAEVTAQSQNEVRSVDTTKPTTPAEVTAQSQNEVRSVITQTQGLDPVRKEGFFKTLFNDKEAMIRLALGFNTMRLKPDDALAKVLGKELEDIRKDKGTNMSFEFLKKTRPDLYNLVKNGRMTIKEAVSVLNLDKFSGNVSLPTMPKDYQGTWDPKTNSFSMSVIPGSKTAVELADAENKERLAVSSKIDKTSMMSTNIDKAIGIIDTDEWATGVKGAFVRDYGGFLGAGSPAINLQATITAIQANIGFDRLQTMREESPTGGALGQVAVQELVALQATLGSLDLRQDPKLIKETLEHVRDTYNSRMAIVLEQYGADELAKYGITYSGSGTKDIKGSTENEDPLGIR